MLPIMTITAFVIGYNISAPSGKKILERKPKHKPTEDEEILDYINRYNP